MRNKMQPIDKRRTEIGVITNGTLIHNYIDQLQEISPDYFDISIDGLPETHDAIRGKGTFKKLQSNLTWLTDSYPGQFGLQTLYVQKIIIPCPNFSNSMTKTIG